VRAYIGRRKTCRWVREDRVLKLGKEQWFELWRLIITSRVYYSFRQSSDERDEVMNQHE